MITAEPGPGMTEEKIQKSIAAQKEDPAKIEERYRTGAAV